MKKLISITICVLLILSLSANAFADYNEGALWYTAKENINVRSGPSENYTSYGLLLSGEKIGFPTAVDLSSPSWRYGYPSNSSQIYIHYINQGWAVSGYVYTANLRA